MKAVGFTFTGIGPCEQLTREPKPLPRVHLRDWSQGQGGDGLTAMVKTVLYSKTSHLEVAELVGYEHHDSIQAPVAV